MIPHPEILFFLFVPLIFCIFAPYTLYEYVLSFN